MTLTQARARCAELQSFEWNADVIERAITRTTALFVNASPQVTPVNGAPGLWWVGASGLEHVGGERALVKKLLTLARTVHPHARVAVADSCVVARAATWQSAPSAGDACIVPVGGCAEYLAKAPLSLIPMDAELRDTLHALGLRTAGAFASLTAQDVEQRWGDTGMTAWRLAQGDDLRRPVLARMEGERVVTTELATSTETMEPILFLVRAGLDRLVTELASEGRAVAAVAITLTLDDARGAMVGAHAHTITREARPARPLARVAPLFERCRALLDAWKLEAPACAVSVRIVATAPASADQGDLLDTSWRDVGAIDAALARLRSELGIDSVVKPVARDEHRPESAGVWEPVDSESKDEGKCKNEGEKSASRIVNPPEEVQVECAAGAPALVHWRGDTYEIDRAAGPERLAGDWWKDGYTRDYWRCASAAGELMLYHAHPSEDGQQAAGSTQQAARSRPQWFLQGWYD